MGCCSQQQLTRYAATFNAQTQIQFYLRICGMRQSLGGVCAVVLERCLRAVLRRVERSLCKVGFVAADRAR